MKQDSISIEIINWEKYNPRGESKKPSWFRFENSFFSSQTFCDFTLEERIVWLFLCCEASKRNSGAYALKLAFVTKSTGVKEKAVISALEKLNREGVLGALVRHSHETRTTSCESGHNLPATDGRTDPTDERTPPAQARCEFDLESLYGKYPRKEGKTLGLKKAAKEIQTAEDFEAFSRAIDRYAAHCRSSATEPKFIKHFSTFVSCWRDWLDPQAGRTSLPNPPEKRATVFSDPAMEAPHSPPPPELMARWRGPKSIPTGEPTDADLERRRAELEAQAKAIERVKP